MPKKLTLPELRWVRCYIAAGGTDEFFAAAVKKAHISLKEAKRLMRLKRIKDEIAERMGPVILEQKRQELVADAVTRHTAQLRAQRDELQKDLDLILDIPKMKIDVEVLDSVLMGMVVGLDQNRYPREKLDATKTAYVVASVIRQGNTERVIPQDAKADPLGSGIYLNVFEQIREKRKLEQGTSPVPVAPPSPPADADAVFDIMPPPPVEKRPAPTALVGRVMPLPGEAIDTPIVPQGRTTRTTTREREVITVEVG